MEVLFKKYTIYIAFVLITLIGGLYFTIPQVGQYFSRASEIKTKQATVEDLRKNVEIAKKNKIDEESAQQNEEKLVYEPQFKSEDSAANFNGMLETILELAKQSGLKLKTIEFKDIPESDLIKQNHASTHDATLLTTRVVGTYTELQDFLREIYRYQYIIGLNDLKVLPYMGDRKILIIDLSLALYAKK